MAAVFKVRPNRTELQSLLAEVNENQARLDACERHRFEGKPTGTLGARVTCANCGGKMKVLDVAIYMRGYEAAGGAADDIWPGLRAGDAGRPPPPTGGSGASRL